MQVVECVPNFSEGRDDTVVGAIAQAIEAVSDVKLFDVDKGWGANRTVMTFAGAPEPMLDAAFAAIKTAAKLIDMRYQRGAHPRLGATDVCPFVPIQNVQMSDCVQLAERLGERVARELDIPVFLYAEAARVPGRRALPDVRRGEYEGLITRFQQAGSEPDFGRSAFNEAAGATIIGARPLLIAFNVNLDTKSKKVADRIAASVRQSGRLKRDLAGNIVLDDEGQAVRQHGTLTAVRAVGWFVEDYDCAQVSTNLLDFKTTSLHQAYEEIKRQATEIGVRVTGSEVVGLVPRQAILSAGRFYLQNQADESSASAKVIERSSAERYQAPDDVSEDQIVYEAIEGLGLDTVRPFLPDKKILEYRLSELGIRADL